MKKMLFVVLSITLFSILCTYNIYALDPDLEKIQLEVASINSEIEVIQALISKDKFDAELNSFKYQAESIKWLFGLTSFLIFIFTVAIQIASTKYNSKELANIEKHQKEINDKIAIVEKNEKSIQELSQTFASFMVEAEKSAKESQISSYIARASVLLMQENYELAESILKDALKLDKDNFLIYYYFGDLHRIQNNTLLAIIHYQESLRHNGSFFDAHFKLATLYNDIKDYDQSIKYSQKAIRLNPLSIKTLLNLGSTYDDMKNFPEAISIYKQILAIDPDNHKAFYNLGIAYKELGDLEISEEMYQSAIKKKPDFVNSYINLGNLYSILNRNEEAIDCYQRAEKLQSKNPLLFYNMSCVYALLEKKEKTLSTLEQAICLGLKKSKNEIKEDPDFNFYLDDVAFNFLLDKYLD